MEKSPSVKWCGVCGCNHHADDALCLIRTNEVAPITTGVYDFDDELARIAKNSDVISIVVSMNGKLYYIHQRNRLGTTNGANVAFRITTAVAEALMFLRHGFKRITRSTFTEKRR